MLNSSSPVNKVMVAKIMSLSLVWYHASMVPGWTPAFKRIEKRVQDFIWRKSIPKVSKATPDSPNRREASMSGPWQIKPMLSS
jgi:hypothetical protein